MRADIIPGNICDSVEEYTYLRSITLSFVAHETPAESVGTLGPTLASNGPNLKPNPFLRIHGFLTNLLQRTRSIYMHTISIRLAPFLVHDKAANMWRFTYSSTRADAIELLFGQGLLARGSLSNLAVLHIYVQENSTTHDAEWWCKKLRETLGPVPHEIRVNVDYCESSPYLDVFLRCAHHSYQIRRILL